MVLKYLIEKEFKQMRRNAIIPRLILVFPCIMMLLMPWAANLEIKYNNVCVVDYDRSMTSRRLIEKVASTDYFNLVGSVSNYDQALEEIENGTADVILEILWMRKESDYRDAGTIAGFCQLNQWNQRRNRYILSFFCHPVVCQRTSSCRIPCEAVIALSV